AQTLRQTGEYDRAIDGYVQRIKAGGWPEEVWYSMYQVGKLLLVKDDPWPVILHAFLQAHEYRPGRAEPLFHLVAACRQRDYHELGVLFGKIAMEIAYPAADVLFIERTVYRYRLPMEYAACCIETERYTEAVRALNRAVTTSGTPPDVMVQAIRNRDYCLSRTFPGRQMFIPRKNRLKVCVPFYNPGHFLDNCIASLLEQDYDRFDMIFLDDGSTDDSWQRVPVDDERVTLIRNSTQLGGGRNLHVLLTEHCEPNDIFVQLDGDDWLAEPDALRFINQFYNQYDCWVMYGQFRFSDGRYGKAHPIPDEAAFERVRKDWYCPAIRSFRAGLYHRLADQDPDYACMKDAAGNWYEKAMDAALMCSIFEVAGYSRIRFNSRPLYVYNIDNPRNIFRNEREEEMEAHREVAGKRPFSPVSEITGGS
ncbi:MAG: glycosyltransferase family 2 protein, partial [Verrucomicrobiota bacterium]